MALLLTVALLPAASFAQGRGHAYGRYKHMERFEQTRPAVRTYSTQRIYTYPRTVYTYPRTYYYRQPSISFSFPFGYSTYQPSATYYYPNGYIAPRRYRVIRARREHEEREHRFAHERRER
jgi:hypothetical protein